MDDTPILQGDLYKRAGHKQQWKKRFFVLRKNLLVYFQTRHDILEEPLGVIPLHNASITKIMGQDSVVSFVSVKIAHLTCSTDLQYLSVNHC